MTYTRVLRCLFVLTFIVVIYSLDVQLHPASVPVGHVPLGIVKLNPPSKVTAGYIGTGNILVYWYEPENFHLSIPLFVNISDTEIVLNANLTEYKYETGTSKPETETSSPNITVLDWIGHQWVPYNFSHLIQYIVTWKENGSATNYTKVLSINETEFNIEQLISGTTYQISVTAIFSSYTYMKSPDLFVTTLSPLNISDVNPLCHCDPYGVQEGGQKCHVLKMYPKLVVPLCQCRRGYKGLFCEHCESSYFRTQINHPCFPCPCNRTVSNGDCVFEEDKLTCPFCNKGYIGKHCEKCASGYFRSTDSQPCSKCFCHGKSDYCDAKTGFCSLCKDNTAGYSCERCMVNYIGDPQKNQPCIHRDKITATSVHTGAIVAGICVALLLLLGGIVGFIVYRKWNKFPHPKKFWTVELRDDHERVNFSALPEDEIEARRMDRDFYQDQSGHQSSQKYSHLQET